MACRAAAIAHARIIATNDRAPLRIVAAQGVQHVRAADRHDFDEESKPPPHADRVTADG